MAGQLTHESFEGRIGERFRLLPPEDGGQPQDLELIRYRALERSDLTPREQPFAIEFRGSLEEAFSQGLRRLEHPDLGTHDIFLVPVGPDEVGLCYEAIFN